MVHDRLWNSLLCAAVIALGVPCQAVKAADLSLTLSPIVFEPEPVDRLHPRLGWMRKDRIRTAWVATDLHTLYGGTDRTKARIMADGGLNVAVVSMHSDPKDRSFVPDLAKVLPANVRVAHENGLALWTEWNYGSQHQEPYHRYRAPDGTLAKKTCEPFSGTACCENDTMLPEKLWWGTAGVSKRTRASDGSRYRSSSLTGRRT